jgi:hypothetical protein
MGSGTKLIAAKLIDKRKSDRPHWARFLNGASLSRNRRSCPAVPPARFVSNLRQMPEALSFCASPAKLALHT